MFIRAKNTPHNVSGNWISTKIGENFTKYIRLQLCTEKMILNMNLE